MYSDRFYPGYTYMVSGNKTLYRVDLKDFSRKKLHVFDKPVYGMSSSPDGTRIAVLYAHDDYIGPGADLLVLDQKGNMLLSRENAAFLSHSDGFLFVYPLAWEDNSVLILPADNGESSLLGKIRFDTSKGTSDVMRDERITEQIKRIFGRMSGSKITMFCLPSPGRRTAGSLLTHPAQVQSGYMTNKNGP